MPKRYILGWHILLLQSLPRWLSGVKQTNKQTTKKNLPANAGDARDVSSLPSWGRSSEGRNDNPFQYSCLENPLDRRAWSATVHEVTKSWTWLEHLSTCACMHPTPLRIKGPYSEVQVCWWRERFNQSLVVVATYINEESNVSLFFSPQTNWALNWIW